MDPLRGKKRRRSGTELDLNVAPDSDGKAQPNNNSTRAPSTSFDAPQATQGTQVQETTLRRDSKLSRKIGEPRHDVQKRLQWHYEQKKRKY